MFVKWYNYTKLTDTYCETIYSQTTLPKEMNEKSNNAILTAAADLHRVKKDYRPY